MVGFAQRHQF